MSTLTLTPALDAQQGQQQRPWPSFIAPAAPGMPDPVVTYHADNLTVEQVEYHNAEGKCHREDEPAITQWYDNGVKRYEKWLRDGKLDRAEGPASTKWYANGGKSYERWLHNSKLDRDDGPAEQSWYNNGVIACEVWRKNGEPHREDGPAWQTWHTNGVKEYEEWWTNGKQHRKDGPAVQHWHANGVKCYECFDGKMAKHAVRIGEMCMRGIRVTSCSLKTGAKIALKLSRPRPDNTNR